MILKIHLAMIFSDFEAPHQIYLINLHLIFVTMMLVSEYDLKLSISFLRILFYYLYSNFLLRISIGSE